jgi:hypothetical protein
MVVFGVALRLFGCSKVNCLPAPGSILGLELGLQLLLLLPLRLQRMRAAAAAAVAAGC